MQRHISWPIRWLRSLILLGLFLSIGWPALAQDGGNGFSPALQADIIDLEATVDELRVLPAASTIARILVTEEELRTLVIEDLLAEYSEEKAHDDVLFYSTLGFMSAETELRVLYQEVLAEQVAGFYDTETDTMHILTEDPTRLDALARLIYAHEYTHALQDAHFDLDTLLDEELLEANPDIALARLALIEGDAQLMTTLFTEDMVAKNPGIFVELLAAFANIDSSILSSAPSIIEAELVFPYEAGQNFVTDIYQEDGWRLVNAMYERPPLSTEHILHPNLYLLYEEPQRVELYPLADFFVDGGGQWVLIRDHAIGEFYLREHLDITLDTLTSRNAAAGWGGDRFMLYRNINNAEVIASWRLVWDTPTDSTEFNQAYDNHLTQWVSLDVFLFTTTASCWSSEAFSVCKNVDNDVTTISIAPTLQIAQDVLQFQLRVADVEAELSESAEE